MVLADSFYYQPVQIDTINTRVNADLFAKEGDANGRGMVVQITENGIIKDTTGITLRLQWSHLSVGASGFTEFEVVDATKGLYKVKYPTSMLHRGRVEAFIRITDNGILSGTRNLSITVERMVASDETIEASDDFSALQTALTRLSIWEATISGKVDTWEADMEATKQLYIDTLSAAEAAYPQELLLLKGHLAEKAEQSSLLSLSNQLAEKAEQSSLLSLTNQLADKVGGGKKAKLEDLDATVLSAIEGGEGTSFNLLSIPQEKSVTPTKTTFASHGKNMVDADVYTIDTSLDFNTGQPFPVAGAMLSPIQSMEPDSYYTQNKSAVICFYDSDNNFIVGSGLSQVAPYTKRTFKTPTNTAGYRTAVYSYAHLSVYQIEKGTSATPYEPYKIIIDRLTLSNRSVGQLKLKAPFAYLLSGKQIILDWATKKVTGAALTFYYDDEGITTPPFNLDIPLNTVSWLYIDLNDNSVQINKKGLVKGDRLVIMEIFATDLELYYYTPHRSAVRLINYTGQVLQHLNGREIIDRTIEENKLSDSVQSKLNTISENGHRRLFTLSDAYVAWENGEKFPIAFYGDSTTDGVGTTGWVGNVLGQDSSNVNAYPKRMEDKLRQATGNGLLRIYNAGFRGKTAEWGLANFSQAFLGTSAYSDVKMIGIGWGINDRLLHSTVKAFRTGFKSDIRALIDICYANDIQPFLVTTQMTIGPGVDTTLSQYLLREGISIETVANNAKRELAKELDLELIDTHDFTEHFVKYSQYSAQAIVPDKLHFGNVGHEFEAQLYFAKLYLKTNWINKSAQLDYTNQQLVTGVPENKLAIPTTVTDSFKVFANYVKADTVDTLIYKAYIFNNGDSLKTLKAFKSDATSLTYVKLNGASTTLDTLEKTIGTLDIGLHTLEVYSGTSATVDFKGFRLE